MENIELESFGKDQNAVDDEEETYQEIDETQQHQIQMRRMRMVCQDQAAVLGEGGAAGNRAARLRTQQGHLGRIQEAEEAGRTVEEPRQNVPRNEPHQEDDVLAEYAALLNRQDPERGARNTFQRVPLNEYDEPSNRFCCLRCLPTHVVMGLFVAESILSTIWMRFGAFLLYEVKNGVFSHAEGLLPVVTFVSASKTFGPFWDFACEHYYATIRGRRTTNHVSRMIGSWLTIATICLVFFLSLGGAFDNIFARSLCYGLIGGATSSLLTAFFRMTNRIDDYPQQVRTRRSSRSKSDILEHFLKEAAKAMALATSFLVIPLLKLGVSLLLVRMISNVCVFFVIPVYVLMRYDIRDINNLCCASPEEDFQQQMNAMRSNELSQITSVPFYTRCKSELLKLAGSFKLPLFVPCVVINAIVGVISLMFLTSFPLMFHDKYMLAARLAGQENLLGKSIMSCGLLGLVYGVVALSFYIVISFTDNFNWRESSMVLYLIGLGFLGFNLLFYYVFDVLDVILWMIMFGVGYALVSYFDAKAFHLLFKDQDDGHFKETWSHVKFASGILIYVIYIVIFILHVSNAVMLDTVMWCSMFFLAGIAAILLLYLALHRCQFRPPAGRQTLCGCAPMGYELACCNLSRNAADDL